MTAHVIPVRADCCLCGQETYEVIPAPPVHLLSAIWSHRPPRHPEHPDCATCEKLLAVFHERVTYYCPRCVPLRYQIAAAFTQKTVARLEVKDYPEPTTIRFRGKRIAFR